MRAWRRSGSTARQVTVTLEDFGHTWRDARRMNSSYFSAPVVWPAKRMLTDKIDGGDYDPLARYGDGHGMITGPTAFSILLIVQRISNAAP